MIKGYSNGFQYNPEDDDFIVGGFDYSNDPYCNGAEIDLSDQRPPFYPFNTFAQRHDSCQKCHRKIEASGWYFRFLHLQLLDFVCEDCLKLTSEGFINDGLPIKSYKAFNVIRALTERVGSDILIMLGNNARTN